ncbi:exodeoxyribonuclease III [Eubacteriales bacterium OttesenSCG-928-N14]|nr:exodeoxyribonuclease III [Eubacteriales bacterium OttesenSCG-928-N14]
MTMIITSWNVNGIRAAAKKGLLEYLQNDALDFVCLQETKAQLPQLGDDIVHPDGYTSYFFSAERKGYSGVATYCRHKPEDVLYGMENDRFDAEGRVLGIAYGDFILFNVYFPNGKMSDERLQYKLDFYQEFFDYTMQLKKKTGKSIIVVGDYNTAHNEIDLARPKENEKVSGFLPIEREELDRVLALGYVDTFRTLHPDAVTYSWWDMKTGARDRNVGWRLDYVYVTEDLMGRVSDAFINTDVMGSDHCPVGIELKG